MTPGLALTNVQKFFSSTQALDGVALTVQPGEVHALLGENGMGKSTFLNILCGVLSSDTGTIEIDGSAVQTSSPRDATKVRIAAIHQELQHVPDLTVAQNIFLGHALRKGPFVDRKAQKAEAKRLLVSPGPGINVTAPIRTLRVAQRQIVEIAKAFRANSRIIAMDEPASSRTLRNSKSWRRQLAVYLRNVSASSM